MSSNNSLLKRAVVIVPLALALILVLLACSVYVANAIQVRKAERLLSSARSLRIGDPTSRIRDIDGITIENPPYSPRARMGAAQDFLAETSFTVFDPDSTLRHAKQLVGFTPWQAYLRVCAADGKICGVDFGLRLLTVDGLLETSYASSLYGTPDGGMPPYFPDVVGGSSTAFVLRSDTRATDAEHAKLFDLKLNCLGLGSSCKNPCAVIGSAWPDFIALAQEGAVSASQH
jgi:hypothetical protein